ncbi:RraA family protein [Phytopseudomonas dryadis]|uniref:Putative 4-hydroxy-4-methyl-2-oxoglutarate aldolase n=1 Tax=Phytopseudomonas dryadis TaxID=2487520 RepID=A0A4Q9R2M8_9GAMM|nr:RraA family protein [Pseudomonas dryadis]TBU92572.1 methyltransferase [Pseudomonas dryadis]
MSHAAPAWPAGFAVNPRATAPDRELIEAFRRVPVAHASDCMGRAVGGLGLRAYHGSPDMLMCGPALTVRVRPGDNLMIHKAMLMAEPGDVIVIDGAGDLTQAVIGGLMRTTALARHLGGFVVNGAVRDVAEWAEGEIPVYALGHVHRGPSKEGPGEVNVPLSCAGLMVAPGDLMLGDADGVVAIPAARLRSLLPEVLAHADKEARIRQSNQQGSADSERIDTLLRAKGCPV